MLRRQHRVRRRQSASTVGSRRPRDWALGYERGAHLMRRPTRGAPSNSMELYARRAGAATRTGRGLEDSPALDPGVGKGPAAGRGSVVRASDRRASSRTRRQTWHRPWPARLALYIRHARHAPDTENSAGQLNRASLRLVVSGRGRGYGAGRPRPSPSGWRRRAWSGCCGCGT
jgi:hypothetical protein